MAEYKVFHCPYGDDFEGGDKCDRCEQYELCMETPTADVVERSKIDKAIECIGNLNLNDYGDNLYQFQNKVIEIVRSIGE